MLAKIHFSLVCLALTGCGARTIGGRDAGTSSDRAAAPDTVVSSSDGLANSDTPVRNDFVVREDGLPDEIGLSDTGPDVNGARPEVPFEAALSDRIAVFPEVHPDGASPREIGAPEDSGGETAARDTAFPDHAGDATPEAAREVQPFVVDGALASFCSGDSAHMIVNGIESYPVVTGEEVMLSCCYSGAFTVTTETLAEPIVVSWRTTPRPTSNPVVIDLSNPPKQWTTRVVAGCDVWAGGCDTPGDAYESGFQGVLELVGDYSQLHSQLDMSICLHFMAPAGSPPTIRSLDFYAPHVSWEN